MGVGMGVRGCVRERECVIITKEKISVVSESIRKGDNIRERGERELLGERLEHLKLMKYSCGK